MVLDIGLKIIEQAIKIFEFKEGRQETFFKNHIEPIYTELKDVHRDYKMVFQEIIQSLDDVNADVDQLAASVKKVRINFEASRESLKALANALAIPKPEKLALSKNPTVNELTYRFSTAILNYFEPIIVGRHYKFDVSPGMAFTSFTSLIRILDNFSASKTPDWEPSRRDEHYLLAKAGAKELAYGLDVHFKEVSECYALLKIACL